MTVYATAVELAVFTGVAAPADADRLLARASEVVDEATYGAAASAWADPLPDPVTEDQQAIKDATCAQVEFWMAVGEAHDVEGVRGGVTTGAVHIDRLPGTLALRAQRRLFRAGLLSARIGSRPAVLTIADLDAI